MTRRIIFILLGALLVLVLMFALWFWLFGKQEQAGDQLGGFGQADNRTGTAGTGGGGGNNQTLIGSTNDTTNVQTPLYVAPTYEVPDFTPISDETDFDVPGVSWLDGSGSGGVGFNPTPINQINNVSVEGTAYFDSSTGSGGSGGVGLGGALLGVGGGCAAKFLLAKAAGAIQAVFITGFPTYDFSNSAGQAGQAIIDCIVRGLAKIAIQQITEQTINWINSGFNGEPAFVTDFNKFFTDVADRTAGEVIQGSDLAFLCSPFQLQVRIAIARSYARRTSGGASQSCTLTGIVGNVENFMNGSFSEGGWPGLIAFTAVPGNNPFGAYAGAQVTLGNKILYNSANEQRRISPGGFLSQEVCDEVLSEDSFDTGNGPEKTKTNCRIVTPGSTIEASLGSALNADMEGLQLADSIDDILDALINSLVTNVLQKGLTNAGGSGQVNAQDAEAASEAAELLQTLRTAVQLAQQYGSVQQGSIQDIQNAQRNLTTLQECWDGKSSSNANAAEAQRDSLEIRITQFNNNITRANTAITQIEQIQSQALLARNVTDVRAAAQALYSAQTSGSIITQTDVVNAQQNRATLQAEMTSLNQQTSIGLNQCYAS